MRVRHHAHTHSIGIRHGLSRIAAGVLCLAVLATGRTAQADWPVSFTLGSPAFAHEGEIPRRHTCEGRDVSPPLAWSDVPEGTVSFVLVIEDPEPPAPMTPRMSWVHWILYNLPAETRALPENLTRGVLPAGIDDGRNDWLLPGYRGPCPPLGEHRYLFTLYALDTFLPLAGMPTRARLMTAMRGHVLGRAELIGTYWRRTWGAR